MKFQKCIQTVSEWDSKPWPWCYSDRRELAPWLHGLRGLAGLPKSSRADLLFVEGWLCYNAGAEVTKHQIFFCALSSFIPPPFFFQLPISITFPHSLLLYLPCIFLPCSSSFVFCLSSSSSSSSWIFCLLFFSFLIRIVIGPLLFFLLSSSSFFLTPLPPSLFLSYTSHKHRSMSEQLNSLLEFKRCVNASFRFSSSFNSTWDLCSSFWKK